MADNDMASLSISLGTEMLKKIEEAVKNEQSRGTGNIKHKTQNRNLKDKHQELTCSRSATVPVSYRQVYTITYSPVQ